MEQAEVIERAVAAIRQKAVTMPHAVRREMMNIARVWGGVDLHPDNMLFISIPLFHDDRLLGNAEITIGVGWQQEPEVTSTFVALEEPFSDDAKEERPFAEDDSAREAGEASA